LAVADEAYGRQIPFAFLERMRDAFLEKFSEKGKTAGPQGLDKTFGCVLARLPNLEISKLVGRHLRW
jgi:hypothetical protein